MMEEDNVTPQQRTKKTSVAQIPGPQDIINHPESQNGNFPSRKRRSVWFGNTFGQLGKYGKLKKTQFVLGASSLEVCVRMP